MKREDLEADPDRVVAVERADRELEESVVEQSAAAAALVERLVNEINESGVLDARAGVRDLSSDVRFGYGVAALRCPGDSTFSVDPVHSGAMRHAAFPPVPCLSWRPHPNGDVHLIAIIFTEKCPL